MITPRWVEVEAQPITIRMPFLTPRLSSLWLGLVTPIYARVGRRLIESFLSSS